MAKEGDVVLDELKKRFSVLEDDRRAFFETSQWTIKQNRETIRRLKEDNKELKAQLIRGNQEARKEGYKTPVEREIEAMEKHVQQLRKMADEFKQKRSTYENRIEDLKNDATELEITADFTDQVANPQASDPMLRELRVLQNKLDKTLVKFNESQQVRLTYEQIVKRLKDERIGFDNQLQALERALRAKEQDMQELVLMMHEAQHAKASAKQELERVDQQLQDDRKRRDKDVAERKSQVRAVQQMTRQIIEREHARLEALTRSEAKNQSPDRAPRASLVEGRRTSIASSIDSQDIYIEAYEKIREATGVGSVTELVEKFMSQKETKERFADLNATAQARVEELNGQIADVKQKMEQTKYAGGAYGLSRSVVDEAEQKLHDADEQYEAAKRQLDRVSKQALMMRVGVSHLAELLAAIKLESLPHIEITDDNVPQAIHQCEVRLRKALEACPPTEEDFQKLLEAARSSKKEAPGRGGANVLASLYEHDGMSDAASDDDEADVDGAVLDRRQVKKGHLQPQKSQVNRDDPPRGGRRSSAHATGHGHTGRKSQRS